MVKLIFTDDTFNFHISNDKPNGEVISSSFLNKTKRLFLTLIIILAIDAFRTLFESIYFGIWYTSLAGLLPKYIGVFLMRPEMVIIPKLINVIAAIVVIALLLKRWLPNEEEEKVRMGEYTAKE